MFNISWLDNGHDDDRRLVRLSRVGIVGDLIDGERGGGGVGRGGRGGNLEAGDGLVDLVELECCHLGRAVAALAVLCAQ